MGFLSRTYTIHRTEGKGEGYLFNSTRFTDAWTLAKRLLQRAQLCTELAAGLEAGTFGFREQGTND